MVVLSFALALSLSLPAPGFASETGAGLARSVPLAFAVLIAQELASTSTMDSIFAVQVGRFRSLADANHLAERLRGMGYDPRMVALEESRRIHVRIGHFTSETDAAVEARKLRTAGFSARVVGDAGMERPFAPEATGTRTSPPRPLSLDLALSSVFDSNIEHDEESIDSYGVIAGGTVRYRSRAARPALTLEYGAAVHSYTQTDRWDRISQIARGIVGTHVGRKLLLTTGAEVSLKGTSEDREIGDQYALIPSVEYRFDRANRVRLYGAYRLRKYGEASGRNATNRYVGAIYRTSVSEAGNFEIGTRFETNHPDRPRNRFTRRTYEARYSRAIGKRSEIGVRLRYRSQRYPEREVEIEDRDYPRVDFKWTPEISFVREIGRNLWLEAEYQFETRYSNDPTKHYSGHVAAISTRFRW